MSLSWAQLSSGGSLRHGSDSVRDEVATVREERGWHCLSNSLFDSGAAVSIMLLLVSTGMPTCRDSMQDRSQGDGEPYIGPKFVSRDSMRPAAPRGTRRSTARPCRSGRLRPSERGIIRGYARISRARRPMGCQCHTRICGRQARRRMSGMRGRGRGVVPLTTTEPGLLS